MHRYSIPTQFSDFFIIHPTQMSWSIDQELPRIIFAKYKCNPAFYGGFIFNPRNAVKKQNRISKIGQCQLNIDFVADLYIPKIGDEFTGILQKTQSDQRWICVYYDDISSCPPISLAESVDVENSLKIFIDSTGERETTCPFATQTQNGKLGSTVTVVLTRVDKITICFGKILPRSDVPAIAT